MSDVAAVTNASEPTSAVAGDGYSIDVVDVTSTLGEGPLRDAEQQLLYCDDREVAMSSKVYATAAAAVSDIVDGATLAVGGFGLCGVPDALIGALAESGPVDLEVFSNNCGVDDHGLGILLSLGRIRRVTASYVGENKSSPGSIWPANSRSS